MTRLYQGTGSGDGGHSNASTVGCLCESEGVLCHFRSLRGAWQRLDEKALVTLLASRDLVATHDPTHPLGLYRPDER